jgi:hypothetical protein
MKKREACLPRVTAPPIEIPAKQTGKAHLDTLLDEALTETFPASDPISIEVESAADQRLAEDTNKAEH